jgi:hypothetical protein
MTAATALEAARAAGVSLEVDGDERLLEAATTSDLSTKSSGGLSKVSDCHCGAPSEYGYRDHQGQMRWYCASHRLALHWADARCTSTFTEQRLQIPSTSADAPPAPVEHRCHCGAVGMFGVGKRGNLRQVRDGGDAIIWFCSKHRPVRD